MRVSVVSLYQKLLQFNRAISRSFFDTSAYLSALSALLLAGADMDATDENGATARELAAKREVDAKKKMEARARHLGDKGQDAQDVLRQIEVYNVCLCVCVCVLFETNMCT